MYFCRRGRWRGANRRRPEPPTPERAVSVAVTVVVMGHFGFFHRHDAAVRDFADDVLELERGVVDAEAVAQNRIDAVEDAIALRRRDVGNGDMAGERVGVGAEAPDVKIVDVHNAFDGGEGGADIDEGKAAGSPFEEDVQRFTDDGG